MRITISKSGKVFQNGVIPKVVINPALEQTLERSIDILRSNTPVLTGRARNGWNFNKNILKNDVPYVLFLDQGTKYIKPRNIVKSSIPSISRNFQKTLEHNIERLN